MADLLRLYFSACRQANAYRCRLQVIARGQLGGKSGHVRCAAEGGHGSCSFKPLPNNREIEFDRFRVTKSSGECRQKREGLRCNPKPCNPKLWRRCAAASSFPRPSAMRWNCLLYTSDAADDLLCVD